LLLLREPLLQFLLLGAILFGLFGVFGKKDQAVAPAEIVVSVAHVAALANGFTRTWRHPPNDEEMQGLIEDYIRDEVLYREGKAAGLDRDDPVIRRRVRQKMEFLAEDMATLEPTEEQLAAYLASHPERFSIGERLTFHHIFLSGARRGNALENDAKQLGNALARTGAVENEAAFGDPFLSGEEFRSLSPAEIERIFGETFARQISAAQPGRWEGPIPSAFGAHFVFVDKRTPGSLPSLEAVRQAVQQEWLNERRLEAGQALYHELRARYRIAIEAPSTRTVLPETRQ
jgi:hypothetical protein